MRIEAISELRKLGYQVDEYGSHTRPVKARRPSLRIIAILYVSKTAILWLYDRKAY